MAEQQRNPNLMNPAMMKTSQNTSGVSENVQLMSEILTKINNAKDKPKKIEVLRQYDTPGMRMILKGAFDPKIEWDLPEGTPPYIANEAPAGTEHTYLEVEAKRLYNFAVGGNDQLNKIRKETLFIQMLEGLHASEAKVLIDVKNKSLNKTYKGLTSEMVKEAFGWNADFVKP
jgi:hypothetical protein